MKRNVDDDSPNAAKKIKVVEGFERLERDARTAFKDRRYLDAIDKCKCILLIDSGHALAHYMLAVAYRGDSEARNIHLAQFHYQHYLESEDSHKSRRIHANSRLAFLLARLGQIEKAIEHWETVLKFDLCPKRKFDTLNVIAYYCEKFGKYEMFKFYSLEFVKFGLDVIWIEKKNFYKSFCNFYKICHPDEAEEINAIMQDVDAFKYLLGDAYENWNVLSPVHQKYVEKNNPEEYKQLLAFSQSMLSVMLNMNLCFDDFTIVIIHQLLFKV